ncbi:ribosomal protein L37AE/L43A [Cytobacillus eiseniae]|uniref:Ribosomal protein L37AE/L43A n=1 Tax=Cytobacillus eiseniae TaxID=762947 RepID=A0ABS4RBM2_9BACI|nr:protein YhfH [Cytobacillus eiseniae]MBP2239786.1 ribosomal protein L37AE/L43A [Cytobacillus eiseniae]
MLFKQTIEMYKGMSGRICPECGNKAHELEEAYLMECDRCLSKKGE